MSRQLRQQTQRTVNTSACVRYPLSLRHSPAVTVSVLIGDNGLPWRTVDWRQRHCVTSIGGNGLPWSTVDWRQRHYLTSIGNMVCHDLPSINNKECCHDVPSTGDKRLPWRTVDWRHGFAMTYRRLATRVCHDVPSVCDKVCHDVPPLANTVLTMTYRPL